MPCFRGVDVSITTVTEARTPYKLPEFPHPDGSSVRFCTPSPRKRGHTFLSPRRLPAVTEEGQVQTPNPKISVYIPSMPGTVPSLAYTPKCRITCNRLVFLLRVRHYQPAVRLQLPVLQGLYERTSHCVLGHRSPQSHIWDHVPRSLRTLGTPAAGKWSLSGCSRY